VLVTGCASTNEHSRNANLPHPGLDRRSAPAVDPEARRRAEAVAGRVAAKAQRTERAEGRQDLVKDRVSVKFDGDGRAIVEQLGEASWYGRWHHGRKTASGTRFDQHALTAAHPTLPLGTEATVTNLANGRSVDVVINDRGPYVRGRDIDLSKAAARAIGVTERGAAAVKIDAAVPPAAADAMPSPSAR
jgi:rare lipoprotein A (peptidoglycan hydrolase)